MDSIKVIKNFRFQLGLRAQINVYLSNKIVKLHNITSKSRMSNHFQVPTITIHCSVHGNNDLLLSQKYCAQQ